MVTVNSVLGRLALFVAGHIVVLGAVCVLSMSATTANSKATAETTIVTGSVTR